MADQIEPRDAALKSSALLYQSATFSQGTITAYRKDWARFLRFAQVRDACPLPASPELITLHLVELADTGRKAATIARAFAAICAAHKVAGFPSLYEHAGLSALRSGIRRKLGTAQTQKAAITPAELRRGLRGEGEGQQRHPKALVRDKALLLIGFAGGFRRSELVALTFGDIAFTNEGVRIVVRRSKTDQEGAGRTLGIARGASPEGCPVRGLGAWLDLLAVEGIRDGRVFRRVTRWGCIGAALGSSAVGRIMKRVALEANLDPRVYSGHSLRAGLVTAAIRAGKSMPAIMRQTGHRSIQTVTKYVREAEIFKENASEGIGL